MVGQYAFSYGRFIMQSLPRERQRGTLKKFLHKFRGPGPVNLYDRPGETTTFVAYPPYISGIMPSYLKTFFVDTLPWIPGSSRN